MSLFLLHFFRARLHASIANFMDHSAGTICLSLREKCPCSEFFLPIFSSNAEEYGPEKLQARTLYLFIYLFIFNLFNADKLTYIFDI